MNCPFCQEEIKIQDFSEHYKKPQKQACFHGCFYMYYFKAQRDNTFEFGPEIHVCEYHLMKNVDGINYRLHGWSNPESTALNKLPEITFTVKQDKMFYVADLLSVAGKEVFHTPSFVSLSSQEELDKIVPRLLNLRAFS